jgi:isoquinoline 1-oxidoreductase/isoquinoline 1-oxidoreductase beta subunit
MSKVAPGFAPDESPVEGAADLHYAIANIDVRYVHADAGIPVSYWRSVGHSQNGFAVESFIDELAIKRKQDPAAFRRQLLASHPRHLAVLDAVIQASDWGRPKTGRQGETIYQGVACHKSFNTYVAQVVDISVTGTAIKVHTVYCATDCGLVVNPDIVHAQMEGGIIFALSAALYGEITLREGRVQQSNFHDYPVLRMQEVPDIQVILVDSEASPTGVGEPSVPPLAPALANAVFAATGKRLRDLPLRLDV